MPVSDNPIAVARVRAGKSRAGLADEIGLSRSTLIALEDGRTRDPKPETLHALARVLDAPSLSSDLAQWHRLRDQTVRSRLSLAGQFALRLTPDDIPKRFDSFAAWREELAGSAVNFARTLGIPHAAVNQYESGIRSRGLPESMQEALGNRLGLSIPYLQALAALPPSTDPED